MSPVDCNNTPDPSKDDLNAISKQLAELFPDAPTPKAPCIAEIDTPEGRKSVALHDPEAIHAVLTLMNVQGSLTEMLSMFITEDDPDEVLNSAETEAAVKVLLASVSSPYSTSINIADALRVSLAVASRVVGSCLAVIVTDSGTEIANGD